MPDSRARAFLAKYLVRLIVIVPTAEVRHKQLRGGLTTFGDSPLVLGAQILGLVSAFSIEPLSRAESGPWVKSVGTQLPDRIVSEEVIMDVLLVDDSKTMRMLVQRVLRQAGYRDLVVVEAENGKHALEKLSEGIPKLILSDWNMPEMNGIEFLQRLRADKNSTPFGFITSEASDEIKALASQTGANFLLTKPFTPEVVQHALVPYLGAC